MIPPAAMPDVEAWPLPDEPYVPSVTPRPVTGRVFEISEAAPKVTDPGRWFEHEAWLTGFRLYRHGYFWETHEVWEPVWIGARPNSAERVMVQGLIQVANACLKLRMGRRRAAVRLMGIAERCLDEAAIGGADRLMGLDLDAARAATTRFAADLGAAAVDDAPLDARPGYDTMIAYRRENVNYNA
ncbi:DUF309 domain-containing protein [Amorphus coralli]|uniref:DUF309 domain-containing protein n=1 Tax=Amorphus coralli TaxID=340680 RepID=UPI00036FF6CF|nr:DUF309 domain-containing protein [Amorphus coralli]